MRTFIRRAALILLTLPLAAQTTPPVASQNTPVLHAKARLVVVDVAVTDAQGSPVRGLDKSAFHVTDSKKVQTILSFEEHSAAGKGAEAAPLPQLQPGVFTNVGSASSSSTPIILLIDYLNTPRDNATMAGQVYLRKQVLEYLRTAPGNRRIAIFGLNSKLVQLQNFTDDPALLRAAVERSQSHSSATSNEDSDPDSMDQKLSGQVAAEVVARSAADTSDNSQASPLASAGASFDLFNAVDLNINEDQRASMTLEAFHQLALYLARIPGRKNLIWFSGAFPLTLQPVADVVVPFNGDPAWKGLYRETVDLLTRSRVAVYPADARGLMLQRTDNMVVETQGALMEMAEDTGGKAYINTNGLAQVIADVADKGSDYYTLAYNPSETSSNGELRPIHIALEGGKGYKLAYRRGYYADSADKSTTVSQSSAVQLAASFMAPPTAQIPFFARVLPIAGAANAATSTPVLSDVLSDANPTSDATLVHARRDLNAAPTHRLSVEYSASPENISTTTTADGLRHAHLEFIALAYDNEGRVVGSDVKRLTIAWTPAQYTSAMQHGLRYQQELNVGAAATVRLLIHDLTSDHVGSLDVTGTALKPN